MNRIETIRYMGTKINLLEFIVPEIIRVTPDGDKTDNRPCNLEWVTNKENAHHAISNGLWDAVRIAAFYEDESRKKPITAKEISTGKVIEFDSIAEAERFIGSRHITDVLKGKRTKAKGYTFAYKEGGGLDVRSNT